MISLLHDKRYSKDFINLDLSVHTVSYGAFFLLLLMYGPRSSRLDHN